MKEMTALARNVKGNLIVIHDDFYSSQKEMATDIRGNGYKVLKIWSHYADDAEVNDWLYFNRK